MKEVVKALKRINPETDSPDTVCKCMSRLNLPILGTKYGAGTSIYRIRLIEEGEDIKYEDELSYKPAHLNREYMRASIPNKTMFYGVVSYEYLTSVLGCLAETCDCLRNESTPPKKYTYIISEWKVVEDLTLFAIINLIPEMNKSSLFQEAAKGFDDIISDYGLEELQGLMVFMNHQLCKSANVESDYWIPAVFTDKVLSNFDFAYDGIIYESTQSIDLNLKEVKCVALLPNAADHKLKFVRARRGGFDFVDNETGITLSKHVDIPVSKRT